MKDTPIGDFQNQLREGIKYTNSKKFIESKLPDDKRTDRELKYDYFT